MRVNLQAEASWVSWPDIIKIEIPLIDEANLGVQYNIIILDADDSVDVIIQHPNGEREAVWSLVKPPE